jgi:hypothetical protein
MKGVSLKYSIRVKNITLRLTNISKTDLMDVCLYDSIAECFDDQMQYLADKLHVEESQVIKLYSEFVKSVTAKYGDQCDIDYLVSILENVSKKSMLLILT